VGTCAAKNLLRAMRQHLIKQAHLPLVRNVGSDPGVI